MSDLKQRIERILELSDAINCKCVVHEMWGMTGDAVGRCEHQRALEQSAHEAADLLRELLPVIEDAERYRWLRQQPNDAVAPRIDVVHWTIADESANEGDGLREGQLDSAIDAARAKEKT